MTTHTHTAESLHALSDAAFTRVVAELDGWTVAPDSDGDSWWTFRKNGQAWGSATIVAATESEAWDYAFTPDPECGDTAIPNYAHDLNAAWGLRFNSAFTVQVTQFSGEPETVAEVMHVVASGAKTIVVGVHDQPARALSTAWLLWKQAHDQPTNEREG